MEYTLIRTGRRTLGLEIKPDGTLLVRAPLAAPLSDIEEFVSAHRTWIETRRARVLARIAPPLTVEEERALRARAKEELPKLTAVWAEKMGITYTRVKITSARCRLGSCRADGGISFSFRLMQYPESVIEYVVVHELAHRKEMNHSHRFYQLVARYLPDYAERVRLMKSCPRAL